MAGISSRPTSLSSAPTSRDPMVGIDIVDVERLRDVLGRSPKLGERLFTSTELFDASARQDPSLHLAGTLAAKEAAVKALGLSSLAKWAKRIEVTRNEAGKPCARLTGDSDSREVAISISHDGGLATAIAIVQTRHPKIPAPVEMKRRRIPPLVFTPQMELCLAEA